MMPLHFSFLVRVLLSIVGISWCAILDLNVEFELCFGFKTELIEQFTMAGLITLFALKGR